MGLTKKYFFGQPHPIWLKWASAGVVRSNPAEAFAKGGNSDELSVVP
jgi:hypothetical protein